MSTDYILDMKCGGGIATVESLLLSAGGEKKVLNHGFNFVVILLLVLPSL